MLWLAPLLSLLLIGGLWDVTRRRIPNAISASAAVLGVAAQGQWAGWRGVVSGVAAAVITLVLLWGPWVRKMVGGGDVKVAMAAVLAVGLGGYPRFLVVSALAGGLLALVSLLRSSPEARREIRTNLLMMLQREKVDLPAGGAVARGRVPVPYGAAFVVAAFDALLGRFA